jgi:hypothetical protein
MQQQQSRDVKPFVGLSSTEGIDRYADAQQRRLLADDNDNAEEIDDAANVVVIGDDVDDVINENVDDADDDDNADDNDTFERFDEIYRQIDTTLSQADEIVADETRVGVASHLDVQRCDVINTDSNDNNDNNNDNGKRPARVISSRDRFASNVVAAQIKSPHMSGGMQQLYQATVNYCKSIQHLKFEDSLNCFVAATAATTTSNVNATNLGVTTKTTTTKTTTTSSSRRRRYVSHATRVANVRPDDAPRFASL